MHNWIKVFGLAKSLHLFMLILAMRLILIFIITCIPMMVLGRSIQSGKDSSSNFKIRRTSFLQNRNKRAAKALPNEEININFFEELKKVDSHPRHNHNQQHHRPCHHRRHNGRRSNCSRNRRRKVYSRIN